MNKKIFWTTLLIFSLTLTACASIARTTGAAPSGASSASELPAQTKLILGTINLEETENAITAEQAKELLPMFYVLQDLNESDTAAQEEKDGLVNQIQETLTAEQVQAIDNMNLTRRDMFSLMQGNSGGTNSTQTGSNFGGGNGGTGGPPPDMGGGFPGGGFSNSNGTSNSTRTSSGNTTSSQLTKTPSALFDAVIKLLEKKLQ